MNYEAQFGILFRHYLKSHPMSSASFELKHTRGKPFLAFSAVSEDQLNHLQSVKSPVGTLVRVQSGTIGAGDYLYLREAQAFIVIKYPTFFALIDIDVFIKEKETSIRKSLTAFRCKQIAHRLVHTSEVARRKV